ncbi:MAG: EAL domain-containing protein [Eubacteriaceae bacterium]|jgi:diguanylate cyclase (GGDEF)-like protein|nr:EAL domain-containing protein [Eubacteriaceae bacterium]
MNILKNLLILDDNISEVEKLKKLYSDDYTVTAAGGPDAAAELVSGTEPFSVLIISLESRTFSGIDMIHRLISHSSAAPEHVIVCASSDNMELVHDAMACGADDCIIWPADIAWDETPKKGRGTNSMLPAAGHYCDTLTGIYSRAGFIRSAEILLQENPGRHYSIVYTAIGHFKVINDLLGLDTGDRILKALGSFLNDFAGSTGTCGRLMADHFVLCIPADSFDPDDFYKMNVEVLRSLDIKYNVPFSIGIYDIEDPDMPVEAMCDRAETALQDLSGNYMQHYARYDDNMKEAVALEQQITADMHNALAKGQFCIYLQPIYSSASRKLVSAEALVRWIHPVKGIILPGEFIPIFEKNGFIIDLDRYIWEQACIYLRNSLESGMEVVPVSVNVSRVNLYSPDMTDYLVSLTSKYNIAPDLLRLEITETAYTENPAQIMTVLPQLRKRGFKILMDDFGSGYSSLNMLKDLVIDILKIDMRFVDDIESSPRAGSMITSIVRMAQWLDLQVIVEGVETRAQYDYLRSIGCDYIQGYYFSKAVPVVQFDDLMSSRQPFWEDTSYSVAADYDFNAFWNANPDLNYMFNLVGGMGIYELNGDALSLVRANDSILELFEDDIDFASRNVFDLLNGDDARRLKESLEAAAITGSIQTIELKRPRRGGTVSWLEIRIHALRRSRSARLFLFAITDITEQKLFEEKISRSRMGELLASLYDKVFLFNYTADTFSTLYIKGDHADLLPGSGSISEDFVKTLGQYIHPDYMDMFLNIQRPDTIRSYTESTSSGSFTEELLMKFPESDDYHWVSRTIQKLDSDDGADMYFLCIAYIDKIKNAESALIELNEIRSKDKERRKYQYVIDQIEVTIVDYDFTEDVLFGSKNFSKYEVSSTAPKILAHTAGLLPAAHPDDAGIIRDFYKRVDTDPVARADVRLKLAGKDEYEWCKVTLSLIRDFDGNKMNCIGTIMSIDEEMTQYNKLRSKMDQMEEYAQSILKQNELYHVLIDDFQTAVFDYDPVNDHMSISIVMPDGTFTEKSADNYLTYLSGSTTIHPDYWKPFISIFTRLSEKPGSGSIEFLGDYFGTGFAWCRGELKSLADETGLVTRIVGRISDINEETLTAERLTENARRDSLTKLYNRAAAEHLVNMSLSELSGGMKAALMVIDIDDFKHVNDTYGHLMGDNFLVEISNSLLHNFRETDIIGRIGGDEFIILLSELSDQSLIERRARQIIDLFTNVKISGISETHCSIGIALTDDSRSTYESLMEKADLALYAAKSQGKNRYVIYSDSDEDAIKAESRSYSKSSGRNTIESDNSAYNIYFALFDQTLTALYHAEDTEAAVDELLAVIGKHFGTSRAYIYSSAGTHRWKLLHEWHSEDTAVSAMPIMDFSDRLGYLNRIKDYFNDENVMYFSDTSVVPEAIRQMVLNENVSSVMHYFVAGIGNAGGIIGFDNVRQNKFNMKEQLESLVFISKIIGTFLVKNQQAGIIADSRDVFAFLFEHQDARIYIIDPDTRALIYFNKTFARSFRDTSLGDSCYAALYGRGTMCEDCGIMSIMEEGNRNFSNTIYDELSGTYVHVDMIPVVFDNKKCILCANTILEKKKS